MSEIADILERAAVLIEPEGAWTQHASARNVEGEEVEPKSDQAACWCMEGAYECVGGRWLDEGWQLIVEQVREGPGPIVWNDAPGRTQAEVVALFLQAAALARGETPQDKGEVE